MLSSGSGLINVIHSAGRYFASEKAKGRRKPSGSQALSRRSGAKLTPPFVFEEKQNCIRLIDSDPKKSDYKD